mmetsp:Transcript_79892/g.231914  ORF Transcript_79892/g.231914 Transcript_79892/m.231914 type:complete len:221 (+) Transcript_79892:881-1543(+)
MAMGASARRELHAGGARTGRGGLGTRGADPEWRGPGPGRYRCGLGVVLHRCRPRAGRSCGPRGGLGRVQEAGLQDLCTAGAPVAAHVATAVRVLLFEVASLGHPPQHRGRGGSHRRSRGAGLVRGGCGGDVAGARDHNALGHRGHLRRALGNLPRGARRLLAVGHRSERCPRPMALRPFHGEELRAHAAHVALRYRRRPLAKDPHLLVLEVVGAAVGGHR